MMSVKKQESCSRQKSNRTVHQLEICTIKTIKLDLLESNNTNLSNFMTNSWAECVMPFLIVLLNAVL